MSEQSHWVDAGNGVRLYATSWGDKNNEPLVLVHGYPDSHTVWEQIAAQLANTFYVIAYDVRGAGKSTIPTKIKDYRLELLAQDLAAVVDSIIPNRQFHLAAHDWGSIQTWESVTTSRLQGRILSYTTLSGPCLDHAAFTLRKYAGNPKVLTKLLSRSWYIFCFHMPVAAPLLWKAYLGKNWGAVVDRLENAKDLPENPTQTEDGVHGVNLYRANFIRKITKPEQRFAHCPVQAVILEKDAFVSETYINDLPRWVKDLTIQRLNANHWAVLSQPTVIAQFIESFALKNAALKASA